MKRALMAVLGWISLGVLPLAAQQAPLPAGLRLNAETQTAIWARFTPNGTPTEVWVFQQRNAPTDRPDLGQHWFRTQHVRSVGLNHLYNVPGMRQQIMIQDLVVETGGRSDVYIAYRNLRPNSPNCQLLSDFTILATAREAAVADTSRAVFIHVGNYTLLGLFSSHSDAASTIENTLHPPNDDPDVYPGGDDADLKPVLYLYAPTPTVCHVRVEPGTPITVDYPAYPPTGWQVETRPDGLLASQTDGHIYPSLFWEAPVATAPNPPAHNAVFLARTEIIPYLETNLVSLGLNARERAEFIQFWLPRLAAHPAVSVQLGWQVQQAGQAPETAPGWEGFFATNQVAITPQPEALIRVRILWEPVSAELVRPFAPPAVVAGAVADSQTQPVFGPRTGLCAVEWGGMRHVAHSTANLPGPMDGE